MAPARTDISSDKPRAAHTGDVYADNLDIDVLIVGAGFSGVYLLHRLRDELGLNTKIYEAATDLGGIWHWNCYPGARVDTPIPCYEFSLPALWKDWTWKEKYPSYKELREYFKHIDKVLEISKDTAFESRVVSAEWDNESYRWVVKTEDGRTARCKWLINALGFAAKRSFPDWKGMENFKGEIHHSSFWPQEGIDFKDKKVAVIGTGATGIQLSQEVGQMAASTTVFQRTPNLCLPMRQRKVTAEEQNNAKDTYPDYFKHRMTTFAGFPYDFSEKNTFDDTPEEREKFYQKLWDNGGFEYWLATYKDMLFDWDANDQAWQFWSKKTRERIKDPRKRDILAPTKAPHAWGTKRPSLEQNFYEVMDQPNNDVVDIKNNPVVEVKENGIVTEDGQLREFDIIVMATGFDSVTGGMKSMGLKDENGTDIKDKWADGTLTYMGMALAGYPNMFFLYGAQGPTAFSNGPSCVELQGEWIVDAIEKARKENITYLNAKEEDEEKWRLMIKELNDKTLFPYTNSWYMGANIPGKIREQLNWPGGFPSYEKETREVLDQGFRGFEIKSAA
ncbi:hypothetical protein LTR37_017992 [Vermiconidia calcicola]|uniref:Uncharacterized protein n=1 Tax=Vermiconidia calcicola TaxID=1690605 RepID=A0ACC3MJD2_9PEZI|nr:hypothetical protein LTR37_017992 [Vermiconidia calcicola]